MSKVLAMNFKTGMGKSMRVSLEDPKEDISSEEIKDAMNLIITNDVFNVEGGLAQIANATITTTEVQQVLFD